MFVKRFFNNKIINLVAQNNNELPKALVIYYSQTGQLKEILDSVTHALQGSFELTFEELHPIPDYPFPWTEMSFFQPFPECVREIPAKLKPFSFDINIKYDLIILGVQVWYLSPSIPVTSFLQSKEARQILNDTPVITVQGVRNMWAMSQERVKKRILDLGGKLLGNIVLFDPSPNLISVVTIVRWAMKGKQHGTGLYGKIFPPAGVPDESIRKAEVYGEIILKAWNNKNLNELQNKLVKAGAVRINPVLVTIEKRGFAMFSIWANFILKKGKYNDTARIGRLKLFKYYLFTVIYLVSPIGSIIVRLIQMLNPGATRRMIKYYSGVK